MAYGEGTAWGLESFFEFNGLVLNNTKDMPDRYRLVSISGLRDADLRESREANPGDDGEQLVGDVLLGGKTISLQGVIEASSVVKLRQMQEALRRAFSSRVELPLKIYSDPAYRLRNLIRNPSFERDLNDVGNAGGTLTRDNGWAAAGSWSARVTRSSAGGAYAENGLYFPSNGFIGYPVVGGKTYTASATVNLLASTAATPYVFIRYTDGATVVQQTASAGSGALGVKTITHTATAPLAATYAVIIILLAGGSGAYDSDGYIDAVSLVPGPTPLYADGDSLGYNWEGIPHGSISSAMVPVQINCKKAQPLQMDESQGNFNIVREFMVAVRATNPRFVNSVEKQTPIIPTAGATTATETVTNVGSDLAQPRIRITGPTGSNPQVSNAATGQVLRTTGSRAAGQWWEFNTATKRVTDQTGAFVPSAMDPTSDWITLNQGDNAITLTLSAGAVAGVRLDVYHRDAWV